MFQKKASVHIPSTPANLSRLKFSCVKDSEKNLSRNVVRHYTYHFLRIFCIFLESQMLVLGFQALIFQVEYNKMRNVLQTVQRSAFTRPLSIFLWSSRPKALFGFNTLSLTDNKFGISSNRSLIGVSPLCFLTARCY